MLVVPLLALILLALGQVGIARADVSTPNVTVTPPSAAAGAKTVYTISFSTGSAGAVPNSGSITITFPAATDLSHIANSNVLNGSGSSIGDCTNIDNAAHTVTCGFNGAGSLGNGESATVQLGGVVNPADAGDQTLQVDTSTEQNPVTSNPYSIVTANNLSTPSLAESNTAAGATGVAYTVSFDTSSTGGLAELAASHVILAFDASTDLSQLTSTRVLDGSGHLVGDCTNGADNTNHTVTCGFAGGQSIGNSSSVTVELDGVTNPQSAAPVSVSTTSDTTPVSSGAPSQAITVTTTSDPPGGGDCLTADSSCSVRQAVTALNGTAGGNILLPAGTYVMTQGADIVIAKSIALQGSGVGSTTIDGSGNGPSSGALSRILKVASGASATVRSLTFTGGVDEQDECGSPCNPPVNAQGGGALFNDGGTVVLNNVAFTRNASSGTTLGGAVSNGSGTLTMNDVSFSHDAAGGGGGLFVRGGSVTGNGVTFEGDSTTCCEAGAVYIFGGVVTLTNTTVVSSGGFDAGAAIDTAGGTLNLVNATLSDNGSDIETETFGTTNVANTILGTGSSGGVACTAPGRQDSLTHGETVSAVTNSLGNNIDQDNSCGLTGNNDQSVVDPKLVPIADNGGPTRTEALIFHSPALGDLATTNCPPVDQRGEPRPTGKCDIGAFEAQGGGAPTKASTGSASNVSDSSATLSGTINLDGEPGGFHFVYGTDPNLNTVSTPSPEVAAGVVSSDTDESQTISGLRPGTKYYYAIVADNSTGFAQDPTSPPASFTTLTDPPAISGVSSSPTDTTATITFTLDDGGANTTYDVSWGTDQSYSSGTTPIQTQNAGSGPTQHQVTLTGLSPNTPYHYIVRATGASEASSGDQTFSTAPQLQGTAGIPLQISDSGSSDGCPQQPTVDWGDGSAPDTNPQFTCTGPHFSVSDQHPYTTAGHYTITIDYGGGFGTTTQYALIAPAQRPTVTNVSPSSGPTAGGTQVTITGTNFTQGSTVDFGNTPATNVSVDSPNQITATSPSGHAGAVDVIVHAGGGTNALGPSDRFTYLAPQVTGINPTSGPAGGGNQVTISGSNFTGTQSVKFGNTPGAIKSATDTQLVVVAPAGSGIVDVIVTSKSGDSNVLGPADRYTYTPVSTPPPTARPKVVAFTPLLSGKDGAELTGEVNPQGLPTTVYYVYGLDGVYQQFGITVYNLSTATTQLGADFSAHSVQAKLANLLPNARYHVLLVAQNKDGMTVGPDETFTTPPGATPPAPTLGQENVKPSGGSVFVIVNGNLVPLTENTRLPSGAVIDALHGSISLVAASGTKGKHYTGTFGGAIFKLTQTTSGPNKGLITLTIVEGAFPGAPSFDACLTRAARAAGAHAALSSRILQTLRSRSSGRFRTRGRYGSGTVRGTQWTTSDRCDGTLIAVQVHAVLVTDFVRHITILVHAGHHYLALAHPPKAKQKKKHQ